MVDSVDFAFERQSGGRRAIEEAAVDGDVGGLAVCDLLLVGGQVELDAIRHEILDQEHLAGDRRPAWDRCRSPTVQVPRMALGSSGRSTAWPPADAPSLTMRRSSTPSGRVKMKVSGSFSTALARVVAGKCCDMHRLAGAVDAALGPGIDVERAWRGDAR